MSKILGSLTLLRFDIFCATSALQLDRFLRKFSDHIRDGLVICILNGPHTSLVANNLPLAILRIIFYAVQPLRRGINAKTLAQAFDLAINASIWVAITVALFRQNSPFASEELNVSAQEILSKFPWVSWVHWGLVLLWGLWPLFPWLLLRTYKKYRRFDCFVLLARSVILESFIVGRYLPRKYQGLRPAVIKCLEAFIIHFILLCLCFSSSEISWGNILQPYPYLILGLFLYYLPNSRKPNLPQGEMFNTTKNSKPEFVYGSLKNPGHIRLVLLHRRHPTDAISCTIFEVSLEEAPPYDAISYTWGTTQETRSILVDGSQLQVHKSAYRVLESQSSILEPRLLWIDSICINQRDMIEKSVRFSLRGRYTAMRPSCPFVCKPLKSPTAS